MILQKDDEELLEMARELHKDRRAMGQYFSPPATLKKLCLTYFVENFAECAKLYSSSDISPFHKMPNFLRNEILELMQQMVKYSRTEKSPIAKSLLLYFLANKDFKKLALFDDRSLNSKMSDSDTKCILDIVASRCPNLEEFRFRFDSKVQGRELASLILEKVVPRFKKLKHFSYFGTDCIGDKQLLDLCLRLPNLVSLKLQLSGDFTIEGLANLTKLKDLKLFHFAIMGMTELSSDFEDSPRDIKLKSLQVFNWCAGNIPQLESAANLKVSKNEVYIYSGLFTQLAAEFCGTSQLRTLFSKTVLPEAKLPNLLTLHFKGPCSNPTDFLDRSAQYTKLTELTLSEVPNVVISQVLQAIGHQLKTVNLYAFLKPERFNDFELLALCPALQSLDNDGFASQSNLTSSVAPVAAPKYLKNCTLSFRETNAPRGLLKLILSCPNIDCASFQHLLICREDCASLYELGEIEFSIKSLDFDDLNLSPNCDFQSVEMMVKSVIFNSPNLECFNIFFDFGNEICNTFYGSVADKLMRIVNMDDSD